ncbi:MAG: hypothetical protein ACR2P6_06200, partial [Gammaproteobacteria bacterium]
ANYVENLQPNQANAGVLTGPAQQAATILEPVTSPGISEEGRFAAAYPLADGTSRVLVSWSPCRVTINGENLQCTPENLADPLALEAHPAYGIWNYDMNEGTLAPVVLPQDGILMTDVAVAYPRTLPAVIPDLVPGVDVDAAFAAEGVGVLHVRSVYDEDGVDTAIPDIAGVADPAQTTAAQRPARFVRIVKPVAIPDEDDRDFRQTAFGISAARGMREIIGYAPIEPDGSVRIKVPANIAFAVEILDANGRRTSDRHLNWLQLQAGEERECAGCHEASSGLSHGNPDSFASVYAGFADTGGAPFPNTDAALWANVGETMAQVRSRLSCALDCADMSPSVDVLFDDVWTDDSPGGANLPKDPSIAYRYADLATTAPVIDDCITEWLPGCRIVINYEEHIHPLWSVERLVYNPVTMLDDDHTCTVCHSNTDIADADQVPAGQLDLSNGYDGVVADHLKSYRELLVGDDAQGLDDMDMLGDLNPPVAVLPSMSANGANQSPIFFSRFDAGAGDAVHTGLLTPAELRLLSEWLDGGAQYYNDPFQAPLN